jgi:CRP-like cAMP-binding protein
MNPNTALSGNLNFLHLGDVLQLLGSNGVTGILRIKSKYTSNPGLIYIAKGNPINALCGSKSGLDALYALFGWVEGEFEFSSEHVTSETAITKNRMEIILDGLRMLDDGQIRKLGPESLGQPSTFLSDKTGGPVIKGPLTDYTYIVDEEEFDKGRHIVTEKMHGNWIWIIMEGLVDIVKETPDGRLTMLTLSDGSFIGSAASFSREGNIRSGTVIARSHVHLGVLDSQRLATEFSSMSPELRGIIISLDRRLRQVTDRAADIYFKKDHLKEFIKDKKALIKQGEKDAKLFNITQGEAFVVRQVDKEHIPLARLYKGDFFGRLPFLEMGHEPYTASVFASEENIEFSEVNPDDLQQNHDGLSITFRNFIENLGTCISTTSNQACIFLKEAGNKK